LKYYLSYSKEEFLKKYINCELFIAQEDKEVIELIKKYSISQCKNYLRLDCYGDREYLNKLYRECGFTLKREIHVEDDLNACLYELSLKK